MLYGKCLLVELTAHGVMLELQCFTMCSLGFLCCSWPTQIDAFGFYTKTQVSYRFLFNFLFVVHLSLLLETVFSANVWCFIE